MRDFLDLLTHDPRRHDDRVDGSRRPVVVRMHFLSTLLSLALVALACGGGSTSVVGSTTKHKATPTPTPQPSASTLVSNPAINISSDGLQVKSQGILTCLPPAFLLARGNGPFLALSEHPASNAGALQQLSDFINSDSDALGQATPPDSLQWVEGAPTTLRMEPFQGYHVAPSYCSVNLDITNSSTNPIQIVQAGLRLQTAPQVNPYQYHLVDRCSPSIFGQRGCHGGNGFGANIDCTTFGAQILLTSGQPGGEELASPVGVDINGVQCGALILSGGEHVLLALNFGSADPLLYVGALELKLVTDGGQQQTLALSQAPTTLAFASPNQFTCYELQGSTFIQEVQGAAALAGPTTYPATGINQDCV